MEKKHTSISLVVALTLTLATFKANAAETIDHLDAQLQAATEDREAGKIYDAIRLFENILATHPYLNRARLELAIAYHQASLYYRAMEQFQIVLDDPTTGEAARLAIRAYMDQVIDDAMKPEGSHHFSQYVKTGVIYNSNINVVPGSSNIIVNGREFFLPSSEIASPGSDIVISASHRYQRKRPFDVDGARTTFEWQSQASLSSNLYTETSDFDLNIISAETGPAFISPGRWRGSLPLRVDMINLGHSPLATALSLNPYASIDLGHYRNLLIESSLLQRDYDDPINEPQNGSLVMIGVGYSRLMNDLNNGLELGMRFRNRSAKDEQFAYDGLTLYAGGFHAVSALGSIYLKVTYRSFAFKAPDTIVDEANTTVIRNDRESIASFGFNRDLRLGALKNWAANAEMAYTDNRSNIGAYSYDRLLLSLSLSRYFE